MQDRFGNLESKYTKVMFENNSLQVELNRYKEDNIKLKEYVEELKKDLNFIEDRMESKMSNEHEKSTRLIKNYKSTHNQAVEQLQKRHEMDIKDREAKYTLLESKFKAYKDESTRK